jgi:hypothetical protein
MSTMDSSASGGSGEIVPVNNYGLGATKGGGSDSQFSFNVEMERPMDEAPAVSI